MKLYDGLSTAGRHWLSEVALPRSPASDRRMWSNARAKGLSMEETPLSLSPVEARILALDRHSTLFEINS